MPGTLQQASEFSFALLVPIAMYAEQSSWIAGLYWYQALKEMHAAETAQGLPAASP